MQHDKAVIPNRFPQIFIIGIYKGKYMGKLIDLKGQKFGKLAVIERAENKGNRVAWRCKCECGNEIVTTSYLLKSGQTSSCGCYHRECVAQTHTRHGKRHNKLYAVWIVMRERCNNPNNKNYLIYGGRGITVCPEWTNDFQAFYDWSIANGYADKLSLERIDTNGNYEPSNCRWATQKEQCNNKRNNHRITYNGKTQTLKQWSEELDIKYSILASRINQYHWSIERAFTEPIKKHTK